MAVTGIQFVKAERKKSKARIAFCAPAGGGKTHSALLVANGLGGKIAVIDTENGSAALEVGKPNVPEFDMITMSAPFLPEKYVAAIKAAEEAGYDTIIVDSLSHAWAGTGGLLEQLDMKKKTQKNSFTAWGDITPSHNKLVEAILQSKCHIIATMRTKADYVIEEVNGKKIPKKVGMAPIQREGMDYEFTIVWDIDQASHVAVTTKDRTSLFDGTPHIPTVDTGKKIVDWLNAGEEEKPKEEPKQPEAPVEPKPPVQEQPDTLQKLAEGTLLPPEPEQQQVAKEETSHAKKMREAKEAVHKATQEAASNIASG